MRGNSRQVVLTLALFALGLSTFGCLYCVSIVCASGSSVAVAENKGLAGVKPIEVTGKVDEAEAKHITRGWKLFLVGTNTYENLPERYDLRFAVADVEALKNRFVELGVPESNITLLTSEARGYQISHKQNIETAFDAFVNDLKADDAAFVYLSGHGFYFKKDKLPYYAPKNIVAESEETIRATGVSIDMMMERLKESPAKFKWMTVDACRNDPTELVPSANKSGGNVSGIAKSFVVDTSNLPETFVFMQSCEDGQFSLESPELGHGLLTHSLLEALQCDDNPAVKDPSFEIMSFELKLVDLLSYVQTRTDELAHLCRDSANQPCVQRPALTNDRLQNAIFLTELRREGLTSTQWQVRITEEKNFAKSLADKDFVSAQKSLTTLVAYYKGGTASEQYQSLKGQLEKAQSDAVNKEVAEKLYADAQRAFNAGQYASAKRYIDEAIKQIADPKYTGFRNDLTLKLKAEIDQAINDRNAQKAESLNEVLSELDPQAANENATKISAIVEPIPTTLASGTLRTLDINGVKVNFHWAPAGSFKMGSPETEGGRLSWEQQHNVELTLGFWIAETETTQELWQAVMGNNPSRFKSSNQLPVEMISWNDCQDFVTKLNSVYSSALPKGYRYAMPTEAQWEYACRAGTTKPFNFGDSLNGDKANCDGTAPYGETSNGVDKNETTTVCSYAPNAWGLYDMHGNVEEWCADWISMDYFLLSSATKDPTGPISGPVRVIRGGDWSTPAEHCRSGNREGALADERSPMYGFRLVLVHESQPQQLPIEQAYPNGDAPESTRQAGALKTVSINGVDVNFHWAPSGTFQMGSPKNEKQRDVYETPHKVMLSQGFWIAETETTQELWLAVMGNNPSYFQDFLQQPVELVDWNDCQDFLAKLNSDYSSVLPRGFKFALPTEAQWEYACRAGTSTPFNFGSSLNRDRANCNGSKPYGTDTKGDLADRTCATRCFTPNAWGLYDMHGNVWEWCADWLDEYDTSSAVTKDPTGPTKGSIRAVRGGSWDAGAEACRSAYRLGGKPTEKGCNFGFRLVLVHDSQKSHTQEYPSGDVPESERQAGALKSVAIKGVVVNFHWAPAGAFMMGSPESENGHDDDEIQHEVKLTQGFWIAETETTQELWRAVMGNNPSEFKGSNQLPVEKVNWNDCQAFVKKLNSSYGRVLPKGYKYSLPTEAQWEYACRAGSTTPFNFGAQLNGEFANCDGKKPYGTSSAGLSQGSTTPVKSYNANAWGLYDMHGNLNEWCLDWYDSESYSRSCVEDPTGPANGSGHVVRGGSWFNGAKGCRSASKGFDKPDGNLSTVGFRLVLVRESQAQALTDSQPQGHQTAVTTPGKTQCEDVVSDATDATIEPGALRTLNINGVKVNFHWAPAGKFKMGSPKTEQGRDDDEQLHEVTLTQGFWVAETETTQELWKAVMGNEPSYFDDDNQLPVEKVTWNDCHDFVQKLNSRFSTSLPSGYRYAMPTEAQWEYACRAGSTTAFNFGSALNGEHANCDGDFPYGTRTKGQNKGETTPVKSYKPNAWGLYDMHGNVEEWCADWYDPNYYSSSSAVKDPTGPVSGTQRVLRGGSWDSYSMHCRSAQRNANDPDSKKRGNRHGFRLVLVKDSQSQTSAGEDFTMEMESSNADKPVAGSLKTIRIAGVDVNFHWAPAGTFMMGSPQTEEGHITNERQHEVTLTQGFWIAETETTQELWQAVVGNNPSEFTGSNQLPVERVSWYDCKDFVDKLNSSYSSVLPNGYKYALPTEAQWEYACRAGSTDPFNFGSTLNGDNANCNGTLPYGTDTEGDYKAKTTTVMSYPANAWGLYDMHGNVWEWTADRYDEFEIASPLATTDPKGSSTGSNRIVRGGSWMYQGHLCRSAIRGFFKPGTQANDRGFRLVLVP